MRPPETDAAAAGTWTLGDLTVHRIGLGTERLVSGSTTDLRSPVDRERVVALGGHGPAATNGDS